MNKRFDVCFYWGDKKNSIGGTRFFPHRMTFETMRYPSHGGPTSGTWLFIWLILGTHQDNYGKKFGGMQDIPIFVGI